MKIYLLGAANPETIRMIRAVQSADPEAEFLGFLDNDPEKKNGEFYGLPILGGLERVAELAGNDVGFVNLITGSTKARYDTSRAIAAAGGRLTNFIVRQRGDKSGIKPVVGQCNSDIGFAPSKRSLKDGRLEKTFMTGRLEPQHYFPERYEFSHD